MGYRRALHSQRKGDLSMKDFFIKIKGFCDSLTSCGEVINEHEHVTTILNGLPTEFESVIIVITVIQVSYIVQAITTMLLDAEARMHSTVVDVPFSANVVTHGQDDAADVLSYHPSSSTRYQRGKRRGRFSNTRIQCQLSSKIGHLVDRCYHRFDA